MTQSGITKPITATASPLRLRPHSKAARVGGVKRENIVDQIPHRWLHNRIPLGGRRVPLCSGFTAREVDSRETKLISAECSDLLLRGCTRGSPAPRAGLFY